MKSDIFKFCENVKITANVAVNRDYVKKIWHNFTFTESEADVAPCESLSVTVGECEQPALAVGKEYAIRVSKGGACVVGCDRAALMRGFFDLVMKIEADKSTPSGFFIPCGEWCDSFTVKRRMVHLCVFRETRYSYIRKMLRFVACLGYTHAVIEFWGTYRYECLPELSWPDAFTKEEVMALTDEARELGVEPVPMINHLGHAAFARENGFQPLHIEMLAPATHVFTHVEWHMTAYLMTGYFEETQQRIMASAEELAGKYAIPSAFAAYVKPITKGT